MGSFLRWTTGFGSRIDAMVSQIENHDALVNAAIRDAKEARARARVQLKRVRQDGQRMQRRCTELAESERRWKERAVRTAGDDEGRALECVRRMKRAAHERVELLSQTGEHTRIEAQLARDIRRIDDRIENLVQQRNLLRTRQSRAEALAAADQDDGRRLAEVDEILERWEIKVSRVETDFDCDLDEGDELELTLGAEEEREALRSELDDLLRGERETPDPEPAS
jgi:phage shock protein A